MGEEPAADARDATAARSSGHEPPIPEDLMVRVFREYERRKAAAGAIDFEDLLELAVRLYEEDERGARRASASATARSPSTSTRT